MFHKVFSVDLNMVTNTTTRIRLIYCQTRHLCCSLPWRKKGLVACSEGRKKETTKTILLATPIGMISPIHTVSNNCLWKSPRIYQLVLYLLRQDSELYFLGEHFLTEKVRKNLIFKNISMETTRFQNVCDNTWFISENINIRSSLSFL